MGQGHEQPYAGLIPVIAGPTAGGKSAVAVDVALALRSRAEVISADAIQVYRGLDIGSGKLRIEERRGVAHHLIDVAEPTEAYSVHHWLRDAERIAGEVRSRGNVPIVVGGTHLYIKAFLEGLFEGPGADERVRAELRAMSAGARRAELERVDPAAAARIHPNDERRSIRALEVFRATGVPISEHQAQWDRGEARGDRVLVGLTWTSEALNARINARVREMFTRGLEGEARRLWESGRFGAQAREALGYKQLIEHFEGRSTRDDAEEAIKIETRRFAKNQRTWLRRLRATPGSVWIDAQTVPPDAWPRVVLGEIGAAGPLRRDHRG